MQIDCDVESQIRRNFEATGGWEGGAVELLVAFFAKVGGWRGLYDGPHEGDESHRLAQGIYGAVRRRLREHPEEVELLPAAPVAVGGRLGGAPEDRASLKW